MNSNINVSKNIYINLLKNNATFKTDNEIHFECILGFK